MKKRRFWKQDSKKLDCTASIDMKVIKFPEYEVSEVSYNDVVYLSLIYPEGGGFEEILIIPSENIITDFTIDSFGNHVSKDKLAEELHFHEQGANFVTSGLSKQSSHAKKADVT